MSAVLARVLSAVGAIALVGGCVAEGSPVESTASATPVDRMANDVFHSDEDSLIKYAQNKLQADCLARNGYPQQKELGVRKYPGSFDYLVPRPPEWAIATDDQARRTGFGENSQFEAARVIGLEAGYVRAAEACRREADGELGPETSEVVEQLALFANQVANEVAEVLYHGGTPEARELTNLYPPVMDCLDEKGYHWSGQGERNLDAYGLFVRKGRFEGPEPTRPEPVKGKITIVPEAPERQYVPAPEEAELAVAAAQCARRSRFADKSFALRLRVTRAVIGKHESELVELTPKVEKVAKRAAQLVGQ